MTIFEKIEKFVSKVFKTTLDVFFEALKLSPNAQGYVSGSITELLLKKHLENLDYEVNRIREKWEGRKHLNHHGDFYFKKNSNEYWFVLESKGVKSNSEKWHKLYNYDKLKSFLFTHKDKISWIDENKEIEKQIDTWIAHNLPKFLNEYKDKLYDYEEIIKYNTPNKETKKSKDIDKLRSFTREEIADKIEERLEYLMSRIKVLETHFVSGAGGQSGRTQATPRKDEFNLISIDIFFRFREHKFLFANPQNLESSGSDVNHLQQNYIMGFVFIDADGNEKLSITDEWFDDFETAYKTLDTKNAVIKSDMQIDNRNVIFSE